MDIQIETISTCSAACKFCTYPKVAAERAGNKMPQWLFAKIIDEVATIPQIDLVKITGLSEPTLDPRLETFIAYVRDTARQCRTEIFTHGAHLSPKRFDALKAAGLYSLVFSLNAVRPEQHEAIMGLKGCFERVCANIDYAIANKGDMLIEVHSVYSGDDFNEADAYAFYERWGHRQHGGHGMCITEGNWAGDTRLIRPFQPNEHCHRATSSSYVTWDGLMTPCCFMPLGNVSFGDLKNQSIREVYNGKAYLNFRTAHAENRADEYDFCARCTRI